MPSQVNLVVALKSEAYPLINHFQLKKQNSRSTHFPIYRNNHLALIVSGIGKENSRNSVDFLAGVQQFNNATAWLNIGIAGHGSRNVGEGYLANAIEDRTTGKMHYPPVIREFNCTTGKVTTVNEVESQYLEDTGYDMEAFGFYSAAVKQSTVEIVHCYKVVSDNKENSTLSLTRQDVSNLINTQIHVIEQICRILQNLSESLSARESNCNLSEPFLERWKFSVTQRHLLNRLLRKCKVLDIDVTIESNSVRHCMDSKAVMQVIRNKLDTCWKS